MLIPQHIIRQLGLEFNTPAQVDQDYHALAERLSLLGTDHIPSVLDKVLSDLVPPDTYLRYDKIVLNCDLEHWDDLEMVIRQQLSEQLENIIEQQQPSGETSLEDPRTEATSAGNAMVGPAGWIMHFLHYGFLPWAAPRDIEPSALAYELTELLANQPAFAQRLHRAALDDVRVLQRLLQQFGEKMLLRLLNVQDQGLSGKRLKDLLQQQAAIHKRKGPKAVLDFWQEQMRTLAGPDDTTEQKVKSAEQEKVPGAIADKKVYKRKNTDRPVAPEKAVYINNAGLILLNPFMSRFLQLHDAVHEKEVVDAVLAAGLLQSLVTGQQTAAEWELVLPKILLGHPMNTPLESVSLEPAQLASGEELITAAIKHWKTLGTTTVDGFRANFLQREGMLAARGHDWHLRVQKASYDMLLDTLPWGISMIKLPWMNGVLQVDWG